jgi:hypothetical protein
MSESIPEFSPAHIREAWVLSKPHRAEFAPLLHRGYSSLLCLFRPGQRKVHGRSYGLETGIAPVILTHRCYSLRLKYQEVIIYFSTQEHTTDLFFSRLAKLNVLVGHVRHLYFAGAERHISQTWCFLGYHGKYIPANVPLCITILA